ncbi:hypothetical protein ACFQ08_12255 [Streptosporangium algeriense]|uniref:Uncharacterized protein n=1 Tax=Streptosporangium algeriense TaxID=1682748 RepID=A0ABW3DNH0_9ACTN
MNRTLIIDDLAMSLGQSRCGGRSRRPKVGAWRRSGRSAAIKYGCFRLSFHIPSRVLPYERLRTLENTQACRSWSAE